MARALDSYRAVRRDLDKNASPSFSIRDFNYHYNNAVVDYVSENYSTLDVRQKEDDDIRTVVEFDKDLGAVTANSGNLPIDYRHVLGVKVKGKFLNAVDEFKKDDEVVFTNVQRMRSGMRGVKNAYKEPSHRKLYRRIEGSKMFIDAGPNLQILTISIDYIKQASQVYLNPDTAVDYNLEANNTTIQFPEDVIREINRRCVMNFMENTENRRLQTTTQLKQLSQE